MNEKKWQQAYTEDRAASYNEFIKIGAGPVHEQMLNTVAELADLLFGQKNLRVLDLGCGTGSVSARILQKCPAARLTCLDGSPEMLARAREQFTENPSVTFVEGDFSEAQPWKALGNYELIVSVGAVHHLDPVGKSALFLQAFNHLISGGLFLCGDPLSGASLFFDGLYEETWVRLIQRNFLQQKNVRMDLEEIRTEHRRIQRAEGDQPSSLEDQMRWLSVCGFERVECHWKNFGFAVFGGIKP